MKEYSVYRENVQQSGREKTVEETKKLRESAQSSTAREF